MISSYLENVILNINPEFEGLSGMFGVEDEKEFESMDRAQDVILKSSNIDHNDWHKQNPDKPCPGMPYFVLRAYKGYMMSHLHDFSDEMALGLYSMLMMNVGANIVDEDAEAHVKGGYVGNKSNTPKETLVDSLAKIIKNPLTKNIAADIDLGQARQRVNERLERMKKDGKSIEKLITSSGGNLTDTEFNELIGVEPNSSSDEKLKRALETIAFVPMPTHISDEERYKLQALQLDLRDSFQQ